MKKNIGYFIEKFSNIPEERWCIGTYSTAPYGNQCCAFGHLGETMQNSSIDGDHLRPLSRNINFVLVNDGIDKRYRQDSPKKRVLAALQDLNEDTVPEIY